MTGSLGDVDLLPEARALADALAQGSRVRVPLADVLRAWAVSAPHLVSSPDKFDRLHGALEDLADVGALKLPASGSWDRSTRPPLPMFVSVVRAPAVREQEWRTFPWRAELGWVASLSSLTSGQFEALREINRFLAVPVSGVVPARLRSAELFGDEKALDRLSGSSLWGSGRLSWELLGCRRLAPPLASCRVGPGPDVLVVENADPYWALVSVLSGSDSSIGCVAWGAGRGVEQSIVSVWESGSPGRVLYAGDLDPEGVAIGVNAAANAAARGFELVPHEGLWRALAGLEPTGAPSHDWSRSAGAAWLGDVWVDAAAVRSAGGRVAQERLSLDALASAVSVY